MLEYSFASRSLRFAPAAWLKWQFLAHAGPTEVAGFGLSSAHDPLYVEDILVVRQRASMASVELNDAAVADLFDQMTDAGVSPARYARTWLHSHPGSSATPSSVDEETFARAFGHCDWSVMAILSRTSQTYARIKFQAGPGGSLELPVTVDWPAWPTLITLPRLALDELTAGWRGEYETLVEPMTFPMPMAPSTELFADPLSDSDPDLLTWGDLLETIHS
jgi:proteasome lid subunit RPN8/RPN11